MAIILTILDFENTRYNLAIAPHSEAVAINFISDTERDLLFKIFGANLGDLLINDIVNFNPQSQRFEDFINEQIIDNQKYFGLKSLLIKAIFYYYKVYQITVSGVSGMAKIDTSVSIESGNTELAIVYNSFIDQANLLRNYISKNKEFYSEYVTMDDLKKIGVI
jgi:hypothetical protein